MLSNALNFIIQMNGDFDYIYESSSTSDDGSGVVGLLFLCCYLLFGIGIYVYMSYSIMKIAEKTGFTENKILAWIPIANYYLLTQIAGKEILWFILFFIPIANVVATVVVWMGVAEKVGQPSFWGAMMLVPGVNFIVPGYLAFSNGGNQATSQPQSTDSSN